MAKEGGWGFGALAWCLAALVVLNAAGGFVFSWLERDAELEHYRKNRFFYQQMQDLYAFEHCKDDLFKGFEFCENQEAFHAMLKQFFERNGNEMEDHHKWTFFGSMFFVSTLLSTVGYGNLHPRTPAGQAFTIVFGLIGIPIMGYVLSYVARVVLDVLMPVFPSIVAKHRRLLVIGALVIALILAGGVVFLGLEGWSYLEACYFSACTLLTIGFGDFLPSHTASKLVTMAFIVLGLGVAASLIAVLTMHVEAQGEYFANNLGAWYDSTSRACCGGEDGTPPSSSDRRSRF